MSYKGRYKPNNPSKYRGNVHNVIYRSLWERKFMVYCDNNESIIEWGSEEIVIPYKSPWDGRIHRYFPDFYCKVRQHNGTIRRLVIEVKPKKQTAPPPKPKRQTKGYLREAFEYARNQAKWKAANEWCLDRGFEFKVLTEKELVIK